MYTALSVFAALIGLAVTGAAVYAAYVWYVTNRKAAPAASGINAEPESARPGLSAARSGWTAIDYAAVALFLIGTGFLLVDLLAVIRDRSEYPFYHYGYLVSGIVYSVLSMLFIVVRFTTILRASSSGGRTASIVQQHHEPEQAQGAE